MISIKIKI